MSKLIDTLERMRDDAEEEKHQASSWQDTIDEAQGEIDSIASYIESKADEAYNLLSELDEDDELYDEAYAIWSDIDKFLGEVKGE